MMLLIAHLLYLFIFCSMFSIAIVLCNVMAFTLILVNIFIAQLSDAYSRANLDAVTRYDIEKAIFVTRIENSRLRYFVSIFYSSLYVHSTRKQSSGME